MSTILSRAVATAQLSSGKILTKHFITSEGLCSDSSHLLYFGLGQNENIEKIDIQDLTGPVQTLTNPGINKVVTVTRPAPVVVSAVIETNPVSNTQ